MRYHIMAFFVGFLLDLLFGDPHWLPHPIRLIGSLITKTENAFLRKAKAQSIQEENEKTRNDRKEFRQGVGLVLIVLSSTFLVTAFVLLLAYRVHPYVGIVAESIMTYQILAVKCLKVDSMKVYACLQKSDLEEARKAVSMIVGRDTECLQEEGVAKAAIETVAENTSDGVIAPMLYTALGGPILGFVYKAVNTMDLT